MSESEKVKMVFVIDTVLAFLVEVQSKALVRKNDFVFVILSF